MPEEPEVSFEQAVQQIESIVQALEQGEESLASSLARYDDGVRLLTRCYSILEQAERTVAILNGVDDAGKPLMTPFDATATLEAEASERGKKKSLKAESSTERQETAADSLTTPPSGAKTTRARRTRPDTEAPSDRFDPPF